MPYYCCPFLLPSLLATFSYGPPSCRHYMLLFPSNMRISTLKLHDVTVLTLCRNDLSSDAAEIVSLNIKTTG
jgi:hypothetical protein